MYNLPHSATHRKKSSLARVKHQEHAMQQKNDIWRVKHVVTKKWKGTIKKHLNEKTRDFPSEEYSKKFNMVYVSTY